MSHADISQSDINCKAPRNGKLSRSLEMCPKYELENVMTNDKMDTANVRRINL